MTNFENHHGGWGTMMCAAAALAQLHAACV
jgi:hypothetical protein